MSANSIYKQYAVYFSLSASSLCDFHCNMGCLSLFSGIQIDQERAGEQIDRTLANNTLAFYSEIDDRTRKNNAKQFAEKMIMENAAFYYGEASHWITSSSFMDNTPKVISDKFKFYWSLIRNCINWPVKVLLLWMDAYETWVPFETCYGWPSTTTITSCVFRKITYKSNSKFFGLLKWAFVATCIKIAIQLDK